MPVLLLEPHHLVLYGRTVPGADPLDLSAEQRGPVQIVPDNPVGILVGVGDVAGNLFPVHSVMRKGEADRVFIPVLPVQRLKIDTLPVDPGGSARFQPPQ